MECNVLSRFDEFPDNTPSKRVLVPSRTFFGELRDEMVCVRILFSFTHGLKPRRLSRPGSSGTTKFEVQSLFGLRPVQDVQKRHAPGWGLSLAVICANGFNATIVEIGRTIPRAQGPATHDISTLSYDAKIVKNDSLHLEVWGSYANNLSPYCIPVGFSGARAIGKVPLKREATQSN